MINNPSENLRLASTVVHFFQGIAFFTMAIAAVYTRSGCRRWIKFVSPLACITAGILSLFAMGVILGDWNFNAAINIIRFKPGFFIFMALTLLLLSAGFAEALFAADERRNKMWKYFQLFFIGFIAVLYMMMHTRVNNEAIHFVMIEHIAIGATLMMASIMKVAELFTAKKIIKMTGIVFLLMASFQLMVYKEDVRSFSYSPTTVTIESGNFKSRANLQKKQEINEKAIDKKRHSN